MSRPNASLRLPRFALAALAVLAVLAAPAARAQQAVNPIHPAFVPLDGAGKAVKPGAGTEVSTEKTCGACHDVAFISGHGAHGSAKVRGHEKASCVQCHADGSKLEVAPGMLEEDGKLKREAIRIGAPRARNCATCHGVIGVSHDRVVLPPALEQVGTTSRNYGLTLGEGAIVSPEKMADSFLDLEGKEGLAAPWDVHAAKLVDCVACHYASNNPVRTDAKHEALRYLTADPRRPSTAEFLMRPDHRLAEPGCRGCHDPSKAHAFLPYRSRHMAVLSCQACHLAAPMGPAAEMVDATVATLDGTPATRFRNVERRPGETLNVATIRPLRPLLVERKEADGATRLAPVNTVSRFRWVSGPDRAEVPFEQVAKAFLDGGRYAPAVLAAFDADRDGALDPTELRLDTPAKVALVAGRLEALGVVRPAIGGELDAYPLAHGVSTRDRALKDCSACHSDDSRVADTWPIAGYLPGGVPPTPPEKPRVALAGTLGPTPSGGLVLQRPVAAPAGLHLLGFSRQGTTNTIGFLLFVAVVAGVALHALGRLVLGRWRSGEAPPRHGGKKVYAFSLYERIWHWTMALSGAALILTGLEIHHAGNPWILSLRAAVAAHNVFAAVLMANAFLSLFYHLTTRAIVNFIPEPKGFLRRTLEHVSWQSRGIFFGGAHPAHVEGEKLNPLQQVTYLGLLNVLFPLQIGTGLAIWAVGAWPEAASAIGGLAVVAPLHNLGAWLFLAFFVMHVYLTTTGRTVGEHLQSMITGYQDVHADPAP